MITHTIKTEAIKDNSAFTEKRPSCFPKLVHTVGPGDQDWETRGSYLKSQLFLQMSLMVDDGGASRAIQKMQRKEEKKKLHGMAERSYNIANGQSGQERTGAYKTRQSLVFSEKWLLGSALARLWVTCAHTASVRYKEDTASVRRTFYIVVLASQHSNHGEKISYIETRVTH